jgi:hypothetical protein
MSQHDYTLAYGTHATPDAGRCAMEWVSHLAGEPHCDAPRCVSPVLRALCIALNDGLADRPRQRLRPYLTRTIGTAGDGLDTARGWIAMDWLVRTYTVRWLELGGLAAEAAALAGLPPLLDAGALPASLAVLGDAGRAARAARLAASTADGHLLTAWAASVSGGRAAREAAWACAGAAVWAAARVAIGDSDADRARALARASAGDAAAVAVRRHPGDEVCGRPSGRAALGDALAPTREQLADSALGLLDRMLPTEALALPPTPAPVVGVGH